MAKKNVFIIILLIAAVMTAAICFLVYTKPVEIFLDMANNKEPDRQFLASLYNNKENYEDVFSKLPEVSEKIDIKAGVISHHFLAKELIADFYNKIGNKNIDTIFLVSPDHYNKFFPSGVIAYTSSSTWQTPFGNLYANKDIVNSLIKQRQIESNDSAVGLEHGIYIEIPFIKNFFPNAKIVPLVLNSATASDNFSELGTELKNLAGDNSILIVSSDFSHDISAKTAGLNDKDSIKILKDLQTEKIKDINSDCTRCIFVLSGFLENAQNYKFNLIDNKNSFDYSEDPLAGSGHSKDSVTSYVSGFWSERKDIQILFVGDLMFDRGIRYYAQKNGSNEYIFDKIYSLLVNNDLVLANLEGPITDEKSVSAGTAIGSKNNYFFTFDPSVAETLYRENIKLVGLANNHILNFGQEGLNSTKKYLSEASISYFGAPEGNRTIIKEMSGIKIAFISYNQFYGNQNLEEKSVLENIEKNKSEADFVIVFCHWGVEYDTEPIDSIKDLAHKFIDQGADLVVGSHPHVIVPMETYNGKRIYYSLGNFIFDQYFDQNVRNGMGLILKIDLQTKQLQFEEKRLYLQSGGQTVEVSD